jgi:hypothetical protein
MKSMRISQICLSSPWLSARQFNRRGAMANGHGKALKGMKGVLRVGGVLALVEMLTVSATASSDTSAKASQISPAVNRPSSAGTPHPANARSPSLLALLPMDFIENVGQSAPAARFVGRNGSLAVSFEQEAIRLTLMERPPVSLTLAFEGASKRGKLTGDEKRSTVYNYYLGNDPAKWHANVPAYGSLLYHGLYDGVDVRVREVGGRLEYDLLLAPGADPSKVVIRADGASGIATRPDGSLVLETAAGPLRQTLPRTWEQLPDGTTRPLACRFRKLDAHHYGFSLAAHDRSHKVVIDPGLEWGTFIGGSLGASVRTVAPVRDGSGDVVIGGLTTSPDFPLANGTIPFPAERLFVARLNSAGSALVWATFFGGSGSIGAGREFIWGRLGVDASGGVVVAGDNEIPDFPITAGAFQTNIAVGIHAFATRFNSTGGLVFSTFLGGSSFDSAQAAGFDPVGNVIVAGTTESPDFPVTAGAFQTTFAGSYDGFIVRLDPTGAKLTYGTFLGGEVIVGEALASGDMVVDPNGFVLVTGIAGTQFPTTPNGIQQTNAGGNDAFLARLHLDGNGAADLKYSTFLGGELDDAGTGVAVDPNNSQLVTVVGSTYSVGFPTTTGVLKPKLTEAPGGGTENGFVTKFQFPANGNPSVVFSTYLGGSFEDQATAVEIDSSGNEIVIGAARSFDFPTTRGAYDIILDSSGGGLSGDEEDVSIATLNPSGSQLLYGSFLGGANSEAFDHPPKLAYLGGNDIVIVGDTLSVDFPVTPGALDTNFPSIVGEVNSTGFGARLNLVNNPTVLTVPAPTLLQPGSNATLPADRGSVLFKWTDSDAAGIAAYEVELSPNSRFPVNFIDFHVGVRQAQLILPALNSGQGGLATITWFWRVRAADNDGNLGAWSKPGSFTISTSSKTPAAASVTTDSFDITGAGSTIGHVFLSAPAPRGGAVVPLSTDTPSLVTLPASVTVPAGGTSADFPVSFAAIWQQIDVNIFASYNLIPGWTVSLFPDAAHVTPNNVTFSPEGVTGGDPTTGTVFLTGPAPSGGATVSLFSANPNRVQVPASVTVPAGATSANFPVTTVATSFQWPITVAAVLGTAQASGQVLVDTAGGATLQSFTISPNSVVAGTYATGTITMSGPVTGSFNAPISLNSSDPSVVGVVPEVDVPVGSSSATFQLFGQDLARKTTVTITASFDKVVKSANITITPNSDPLISSLSFSPNPVTAGNVTVGTVTLTRNAPTGGTIVDFSTSNNSAVAIPGSISVPAGSRSTTFNMSTFSVPSPTQVVITATTASVSAQTTLTVNP